MIFRWFGWLFLTLAAVLLGAEIYAWLQSGTFQLNALGAWWFWLDKDSLQVLQPAVERHISPAIWDPGVQTLLEWPAVIEAAVLGAIFLALGTLLFRRTAHET